MTQNYNSSVFLYNKQDELITYVEIDSKGSLANYYNVDNNKLTKVNINKYKEKNKSFVDIIKTISMFEEKCMLFHMFFDKDDSYCKAIKTISKRIEYPKIVSTIHSYNKDFIESFTVKPSLIEIWSKKL